LVIDDVGHLGALDAQFGGRLCASAAGEPASKAKW
jgi:hypothetical protein